MSCLPCLPLLKCLKLHADLLCLGYEGKFERCVFKDNQVGLCNGNFTTSGAPLHKQCYTKLKSTKNKIIIYIDITYLHHNNTQHVSFLLSFTLILLYFFFIWIFIFIPICIKSIIIYYYFYYFPESISRILFFITNIMLFRQSLLN